MAREFLATQLEDVARARLGCPDELRSDPRGGELEDEASVALLPAAAAAAVPTGSDRVSWAMSVSAARAAEPAVLELRSVAAVHWVAERLELQSRSPAMQRSPCLQSEAARSESGAGPEFSSLRDAALLL